MLLDFRRQRRDCLRSQTRYAAGLPRRQRPRICDTTFVASSECPPRSKKLSLNPTLLDLKISLQIPHNSSSIGVRGAKTSAPSSHCPASGAGKPSDQPSRSASKATLQLTNALGAMYSGNRALAAREVHRAASLCPPPHKPPGASLPTHPHGHTTHSLTPSCSPAPPRSLPTRSGSRVSSPDRLTA